jgi:hypothetical protein
LEAVAVNLLSVAEVLKLEVAVEVPQHLELVLLELRGKVLLEVTDLQLRITSEAAVEVEVRELLDQMEAMLMQPLVLVEMDLAPILPMG